MGSMHLQNVRVWVGDGSWRSELPIAHGSIAASASGPALDCGGRVATPGLVDAHVHLVMGAQSRGGIDLSSVDGRDAFEAILQQAHHTLPAGEWLIAQGWNESQWGDSAPAPTMDWLAAMGDRPTVCWRCDLHAALVNQAVLDRLDLPAQAPGRESGLLVEAEAWAHLVPALPNPALEDVRRAVVAASSWLNSMGITGIRTMEYRKELEEVLDVVSSQLSLRTTVTLLDRTLPLDLGWLASRSAQLPRIIGCKAFFDGTLGSRTARMATPFLDRGDCGQWVECAADNTDAMWCEAVLGAGLAPSIHAIGDAAVARAISLLADVPDAIVATIEHAQLVPENGMEALARIRLSVQPTHRAEDAGVAMASLGAARVGRMLPLGALHNAGARLAFGTDWPVTSPDPMRTLAAAITGRTVTGEVLHGDETIDNEVAIHAMTLGAAEATMLPTADGLIEGAPADVVVWDSDPFTWHGDEPSPRPWAVFIAGRCVYSLTGVC